MSHTIKTSGLSDIGLVRQNNEDAWEILSSPHCCLLADGMGGHQAGEVAANEAVRTLAAIIRTKTEVEYSLMSIKAVADFLRQAIIEVNSYIFKMGRSDVILRGMGTTLCLLFFHPKGVIVAHVGDSRIYRMHQGTLELLTKDHSLFYELIDQGQVTQDEANELLFGNIITKAIGTEPRVDPSIQIITAATDDIYLICSDGLSDLLNSNEIAHILATSATLSATTESLIAAANKKGGRDNVTVVLAKIDA